MMMCLMYHFPSVANSQVGQSTSKGSSSVG
jgi:hypothetical protein